MLTMTLIPPSSLEGFVVVCLLFYFRQGLTVALAGLEPTRDPFDSASQVLGFKVCATKAWPVPFFGPLLLSLYSASYI